jgi:PKD repeat protein
MFFGLFGRDRRNGRTKVSQGKTARARRTAFLNLERLEERLVPSLAAPASLVSVLQADHSLWALTSAGEQQLSPAGTIVSTSTVTDGNGQTDVFAVASDRSLWEYGAAGWRNLSTGYFGQISAAVNAAGDAVVFGVLGDHSSAPNSLWQFDPKGGGWTELSPSHTVLSVSAVADSAGNDVAYAVTSDHNLWEHGPAGWSLLSAGSFQQVSAGVNAAGQSVVYAVLTNRSLWENDQASGGNGWRNLSPAGTILAAAAAGPDQMFAITADQHLWQHTPAGWSLTSAGTFTSISGPQTATGAGEVFAVVADGSLWQYVTSWTELSSGGVVASSAAMTSKHSSLQAQITGLPSSGHSPEGTQVTVQAQASGGSSPYQYSWTLTRSGATVTTGSGSSFSFTPAADGTYQLALKVTDSAKHTASASASLVVDDLAPTVSLGGPYSGQPALAVSFTASTSQPNPAEAGKPFSYSWSFGDGATGSGSTATASHAYAAAGNYTLTVTAIDSDGEKASATATITVSSLPLQAQITGLPASGYSPMGTKVTLGSSVSGGVGADAYSWTVTQNGATVATGTGSSLAFTPSSTGTYQVALTVTDTAADKVSASGSVVVDLLPTVSLVDPAGQAGTAIGFTASAFNSNAGEAAGFTYSWNFGDGATDSGTSATDSHAYAAAGTYTATVTATDSVGEQASASTTVTIAAALAATITGLPASGYSAVGTQVTLGSSVSGGVGGDSYAWTVTEGGATVATGTGSSFAFTPSGTGTYQVALNVTDAAADKASASGSMVVDQPPTASLGGPYSGQAGSAIGFTVSASNPNAGEAAGFTYSWSFGDGTTDSGTSATDSHAYAAAGTYTATVTATDSVGEQATATATVTVTVSSGSAIILDDSGTGFSETGTGWQSWPTGYGGEQQYNSSAPGTASASWQISGVTPSSYQVQATWNGSSNHTSAAAYSIYDGGTLVETITVSQLQSSSGPVFGGQPFQTLATVPLTSGTITVTLTNQGSQDVVADAVRIAPAGSSPTVTLGGPYSGQAGSAIAFTASASNPNAGEAAGFTYSWSFGDGATDSGTSATDSHAYANAGNYTVTVTATDSVGETASATATVSVLSSSLQTIVLDGTSYALAGSAVAFSVSNPNQPQPGGFTYHWTFGDGSTDITTTPADSHSYVAIGTYTATVNVTDAAGDQSSSSAPVTISNNSTDPLFTPVVNQSSFTYVGSFALPHSANGADTAYSFGGLTYRYVNGNLQFFSTQSNGDVYEFNNPGVSTDQSNLPQAQVVNNWGNIYSGQKLDYNGGSDPTYGIFYDPSSNRLYWTYGDLYNAAFPMQQSMGYSTLNDATGVATGAGAWSLTNRPEKYDRGGVLQIPQWFANRYTGGDTLGVGFGGYFSIVSGASFGPSLAAIAPPDPAVNPDDSSLANVPLIGYPYQAPDMAHRDTNYTSYYYGTYPTTPGQWNPTNGTGYWTWSDSIFDGGVWINTPGMQGVLFIAKVGQGDVYYQSSDRHAQSGQFEWMVYNPADLAAVASGAKQQWQIQPEYEWTTPALTPGGDANGYTGDGGVNVEGVVFDPTTSRLSVLVSSATGWNGYEAWPEMYVFQVGPPSVATTPGNPVVVADGQAGFSETGTGWTTAPNGYMGEPMQISTAAPGAATATWSVSGLAAGWYNLAADWNAGLSSNTSAAVYQIYDGSTLVKTVTVNQQQTPSGQILGGTPFQNLATVQITSGHLTVVVSSQASGDLVADALFADPLAWA